jgi:hypothetical protein
MMTQDGNRTENMTLTEFEYFADAEFAKYLPVIADAEDDSHSEKILSDLYSRLEQTAISQGVEVCKRMAWFLVFALYDMHLFDKAEELGVPPDYFEGDRPQEAEALAYLHERRLGAPPRHNDLTVN